MEFDELDLPDLEKLGPQMLQFGATFEFLLFLSKTVAPMNIFTPV